MHAIYVDHMGDDLSVVKAAKVSFANDFDVEYFLTDEAAQILKDLEEEAVKQIPGAVPKKTPRSHAALIRYLAKHEHWTPFAHTSITLRMQAPVPIRTQCFKHKVGFVENEESRRYISSRPELFVPEMFRQAPDGDKVKQGSAGDHPDSHLIRQQYIMRCEDMISFYEELVRQGVAPEQARFVLPQGCEVNWYWTGSLYAFANAYNKRVDSHAQGEVRDLFLPIGDIMAELFPVSWAALTGVPA
jgi:thymidylate synthase (FAD)